MTNIILCDVTASISELKNDPVATASAGGGYPTRSRLLTATALFFIVCPRLCMNKCSMRWTKKTWCNCCHPPRPEGRGFLQRSDRSLTRLGGFLLQRAA